jgi:hypothetical protein
MAQLASRLRQSAPYPSDSIEAERDARTREWLKQWYTTREGSEREERHNRLAHDLAKLEVACWDFLLRLMALPKE